MKMRAFSNSKPIARRSGQTLLEVILATSLMAIALVSSLRLMRDTMKWGREVETHSLLATFAVSKLEEQLAMTSASWATTTQAGNFAAEGYSNLRYSLTRSDLVTDGGMPDELMAINVTVWNDENGDTNLNAGEPNIRYRSKIAQLTTYQNAIP